MKKHYTRRDDSTWECDCKCPYPRAWIKDICDSPPECGMCGSVFTTTNPPIELEPLAEIPGTEELRKLEDITNRLALGSSESSILDKDALKKYAEEKSQPIISGGAPAEKIPGKVSVNGHSYSTDSEPLECNCTACRVKRYQERLTPETMQRLYEQANDEEDFISRCEAAIKAMDDFDRVQRPDPEPSLQPTDVSEALGFMERQIRKEGIE